MSSSFSSPRVSASSASPRFRHSIPQQHRLRSLGERDHGGVLESAFDGDRVEALADVPDLADALDAVLILHFAVEDRWRKEETGATLSHDLDEGAVVELSANEGGDAL